VHFEPFVAERRLAGWVAAIVLYSGVSIFAASVGVAIADSFLTSSFTDAWLLLVTGGVATGAGLVYKLLPRLEELMDRPWPFVKAITRTSSEPGASGDDTAMDQ
jgi:hypothetical protein